MRYGALLDAIPHGRATCPGSMTATLAVIPGALGGVFATAAFVFVRYGPADILPQAVTFIARVFAPATSRGSS